MTQRNYTVDIFRIIGAFCVVALHSPLGNLPNSLALAIRLGSRWAVPFFFLVSGYFAAQSLRNKTEINFTKSINNLLGIFIIANIIYVTFYVLDADSTTNIKLTFIGLLVGQVGHLWFIGSTILGLLVLQYATNRYSDGVIAGIAITILISILLCDGYSRITGVSMQYEIARYLTSIPFLFTGFLIARHDAFLQRVPAGLWAAVAVLGFIIEAAEAITLYKITGASPHNQELLAGTAIIALGVFCLSLVLVTPQDTALSKAGRTYSLLIYLYHPMIIAIIYSILKIGNYNYHLYWVSPPLAFACTLLIVWAIKKNFPPAYRVISGM